MGTLANTDFETKTHRFGISKTGEWGYLGASYQDISYTYGIPFHGEHGHEEGHDEHNDDHDDHEGEDHDDHEGEDHGDHEGEEHHEEHEGERIVSQTDSTVLSLAGQLNLIAILSATFSSVSVILTTSFSSNTPRASTKVTTMRSMKANTKSIRKVLHSSPMTQQKFR